jgi:diaminopimelate epimerase
MKLKTCLISGAGNTFQITDESSEFAVSQKWSHEQKSQFSKTACNKNVADGFIFLKKTPQLAWDFFNNDGSVAEMCGNATRCVGYFLSEVLKEQANTWNLKTTAGDIQIEKISAEQYKIKMTEIKILKSELGFFCDTGVPHLILEIDDLAPFKNLKKEAALLRNHKDFNPRGTNVTYVQLLEEKNKVKAVSYERGVEDFTEACGTGAMAAAAYNLMKRGSAETQVEMPGGTLMMNLLKLKEPIMIGPAKLIGNYEYDI